MKNIPWQAERRPLAGGLRACVGLGGQFNERRSHIMTELTVAWLSVRCRRKLMRASGGGSIAKSTCSDAFGGLNSAAFSPRNLMCMFFFRRVSSVSQMSVWEINCYLFYFCFFPPQGKTSSSLPISWSDTSTSDALPGNSTEVCGACIFL